MKPSAAEDGGWDLSGQSVDDEAQEERQHGQHHQRNDVLLIIPPDVEDEGLYGIHEPGEGQTGAAGRSRRVNVAVSIAQEEWELSLSG